MKIGDITVKDVISVLQGLGAPAVEAQDTYAPYAAPPDIAGAFSHEGAQAAQADMKQPRGLDESWARARQEQGHCRETQLGKEVEHFRARLDAAEAKLAARVERIADLEEDLAECNRSLDKKAQVITELTTSLAIARREIELAKKKHAQDLQCIGFDKDDIEWIREIRRVLKIHDGDRFIPHLQEHLRKLGDKVDRQRESCSMARDLVMQAENRITEARLNLNKVA